MDNTQNNPIEYAGLSYKFWANEEPIIHRTRGNVFRHYRESGVLSVSSPDFPDRTTGMPRIGKTVSVPLAALIESPEALKALIDILCACRDKVSPDVWQALK